MKLLMSKHPDYMRDAYQLGITQIVLPELDEAFLTEQNNPHHMYTVGEHLMQTLLHTEADKSLRIAALLHDIGKPRTKTTDAGGIDHFYGHAQLGEKMAFDVLKRLKFDNDTITKVRKYVQYHDYDIEPNPKSVRRAINKIGEAYFAQVLVLKKADALAQSTYQREEKLEHLATVWNLYEEILNQCQCVSLKTLAITGNDLIALGVPKGKMIGSMLQELLEDVIKNPEHNTHEFLVEYALKMM